MKYPALVAILGAVLLAGCAGAPQKKFSPAPAPKDDEALVYIYRPGEGELGATATIFIDGVRIGDFSPWAYTYVYIKPGTYIVMTQWADNPKLKSDDSFAGGQTYVIRLAEPMSYSGGGATTYISPSLTMPSEERAQRELSQCTYRTPRKEHL